jgi:hypothetical protein
MGEGQQSCYFRSTLRREKGSVKWCFRDAIASTFVSKFRGEAHVHFHLVAAKATVLCGIDCLACQD